MSTVVPKGYKQTKVGVIPEDWDVKKLGFFIQALEAGVSVNSTDGGNGGEKRILKTSAISEGKFIPEESKTILEKDLARAKLNPKKNSLIISRMNTPELVGAIGVVKKDYPDLYLPDRLWQTKFSKTNPINPYWLNYLLNTEKYKTRIQSLATGTSNSMKNIAKTALLNVEIGCPSLNEQQKIAEILSTWDDAIARQETLIAQKERYKKGLMQKLLSGEVRFAGFSGEWEEVKLGKIAKVTMGQSPSSDAYNDVNVGLPLIQGNADCKNRKTSPRIFTSQKTKECFVGDIVMSVRAPVGTIAKSVHNACIGRGVCAIRFSKDNDFLYHLLVAHESKWKSYSQGSTFEAVNGNDIKNLRLKLPVEGEQQKIAEVLTAADNEIEALKKALQTLKDQKKGLMQQLLTGKVRVSL